MGKPICITLIFCLLIFSLFSQDVCSGQPGNGNIFNVVQDAPRFPGCEHIANSEERKLCSEQKLIECYRSNLYYPQIAFQNNIEGTVVAGFVVEKNGCLTEIQILSEIGGGTSEEAIRLIELMNDQGCRWKPGIQQGDTVRTRFNMPIKFRITDSTRVYQEPIIEYMCCDPLPIGTHELASGNLSIEISPNPASDYITIKSNSLKEFKGFFYLLDIRGEIYRKEKILFTPGIENLNIDVSKVNSGIGIILIADNKNNVITRQKILITK